MTTSGNPESPNAGPGRTLRDVGGSENGLGILAAIIGILTVCCSPCLWFAGSGASLLFDFVPAVAALVLGIVHLRRIGAGRATNPSLAVIGIVLGVIGLVIAIGLSATAAGTSWHNGIR